MANKARYIYNPNTDSYERLYPTMRTRLLRLGRALLLGALFWGVVLGILWLCFGFHNETYIVRENSNLKTQYTVLEDRLNAALKIMEDIRSRDDNFYRVMLQLDPMKLSQRYAGLSDENRYAKLQNMSDAQMLTRLSQNIDLLERQLYAQSTSFDQLRTSALSQRDKMRHIPSSMPIDIKEYTMSSGYGYRTDPVFGTQAFHAGLDFAAAEGTPVYATADGTVQFAGRAGGYGNKIDISHGFNYVTRYGHLSQIDVKQGQKVKRGEKIGEVGSTGKSTGPHLHYEVRYKDEPQNPVNYYFLDVTPEEYQAMVEAAEKAGHVMD